MLNDELSEAGRQRRQAILALAKSAARTRRSKRVLSRGFLAILPIAIGAAWIARMQMEPLRTAPVIARPSVTLLSPSAPAAPPASVVEYIQTDPTITDRLTLPPVKPRWVNIDDRELLNELAAAGQPVGIVCMNGKTILLPR